MKKPLQLLPIFLGMILMLGAACADPAANAPAAQVQEPAAATEPAPAETTSGEEVVLEISPESKIGFVGSKVTGSHDGGFNDFNGTITLVGDDPTASAVEVEIDTTSLWSDNDNLTGHLKSDDFFAVETYPTATFESTEITANAEGGYTITGNLDLHGVTKQISFPATITVEEGSVRAEAEFSIKRFDFGIVYPGRQDDLIRDDVLIKLDLQAS